MRSRNTLGDTAGPTLDRDLPAARPDTGRPTKFIKITATPAHHRTLQSAADRAGLPLNAFVKHHALKAARETPK